ncbi:MAG: cation diffusion facilitator family transporter [Actinomycetota bacterium]
MADTHEHVPHRGPDRTAQRRAIWLALAANAALMATELSAGLAFRSLALVADGFHLLTDVSGLAISVLAIRLARRPATARHTFGLERAEVLAAQANGIVLLLASGWVVFEAVRRLGHPERVSGAGLVVVAGIGLVVNLGSAWLLRRAAGASLNMRGAFLHLASDALGSLGALAAGVAVLVWHARRVDPVVSLFISVLVVWAAWRLLRDATNVFLEGTPRGMSSAEVERAISEFPEVLGVHHLHLWNLASDDPALSAHVVLPGTTSMHDAQVRGERLKAMLAERFGVEHATLEMECHGHSAEDHAPLHPGGGRSRR